MRGLRHVRFARRLTLVGEGCVAGGVALIPVDAVEQGRANEKLAKAELATIQSDVTNHSLRRTFASLLYEAGASPAYVMSQMGHESSAMALEVYARVMERKRETGARMDELVRGADWAQMGTNALEDVSPVVALENEEAA